MEYTKNHSEVVSFGFSGEVTIEGKISHDKPEKKLLYLEEVRVSIWSGVDVLTFNMSYEQYESFKKAFPIFCREFDKFVKEKGKQCD